MDDKKLTLTASLVDIAMKRFACDVMVSLLAQYGAKNRTHQKSDIFLEFRSVLFNRRIVGYDFKWLTSRAISAEPVARFAELLDC